MGNENKNKQPSIQEVTGHKKTTRGNPRQKVKEGLGQLTHKNEGYKQFALDLTKSV